MMTSGRIILRVWHPKRSWLTCINGSREVNISFVFDMSHSDFTKSLRINREHWRTNRLFQETFSYLALKLKTSMNWTKNMTNVLARQCNFSYGFQNMYDSIYIIPTSFKYCWEKYGKTCIILHKIYFDVSTTDMLLYVVFNK